MLVVYKKNINTLSEIAILCRRRPVKDEDIFQNFLRELHQITSVAWLSGGYDSDGYDSRLKVFDQSIKIQTADSSKGLEYSIVIIMWADLFEPHTLSDVEMEQSRLYVALTRATDILIITYSNPNTFVEKMIASGDIIYKQISMIKEKIKPKDEIVPQKNRLHSREEILIEFPNAGAKWSSDDDERLRDLYLSGKTIKELVQIFKRKPGGIESRLRKLKLKE